MKVVAGVHVPERDDRVRLLVNGWSDAATVVGVAAGGAQLDIRFDSGFQLRVPARLCEFDGVLVDVARVAAADPMVAAVGHEQVVVLRALAAAGIQGMLDHDHEALTGLAKEAVEELREPLVKLGLVIDSRHRRKTPRGRSATVWCITSTGSDVLALLDARGAA